MTNAFGCATIRIPATRSVSPRLFPRLPELPRSALVGGGAAVKSSDRGERFGALFCFAELLPFAEPVLPLRGGGVLKSLWKSFLHVNPGTPLGRGARCALGRTVRRSRSGRSPLGGRAPRERGELQPRQAASLCWRREDERNYTKRLFCEPKGARSEARGRAKAINCQPPNLAAEGGGGASNCTKHPFCKPGAHARKAVNCGECADLGAGAASRAKRDIGAVRGASAAHCAAPRRSARLIASVASSRGAKRPSGERSELKALRRALLSLREAVDQIAEQMQAV